MSSCVSFKTSEIYNEGMMAQFGGNGDGEDCVRMWFGTLDIMLICLIILALIGWGIYTYYSSRPAVAAVPPADQVAN
jgi:predicted negative regulator of RcsB-dependent stress response